MQAKMTKEIQFKVQIFSVRSGSIQLQTFNSDDDIKIEQYCI